MMAASASPCAGMGPLPIGRSEPGAIEVGQKSKVLRIRRPSKDVVSLGGVGDGVSALQVCDHQAPLSGAWQPSFRLYEVGDVSEIR